MDERTVFLNVLEEENPERCRAGNLALRERIEALLRSH
jgi:hypothetical protein